MHTNYIEYFWGIIAIIYLIIAYRYIKLSHNEKEISREIKDAFPDGKYYVRGGGFTICNLDEDKEEYAKNSIELGAYMLSSSRTNRIGFLLAGLGSVLAFLAAIATFLLPGL